MTDSQMLIGDDGELLTPVKSTTNPLPVKAVLEKAFFRNSNSKRWLRESRIKLTKELHKAERKILLYFGLFILALTVFSYTGRASEIQTLNELTALGEKVDAKVLSKEEVKRNKSTIYQITYEFNTDYGWPYHGTMSVEYFTFNALTENATLPIVYLRRNPAISRLASDVPVDFNTLIWGELSSFLKFWWQIGIMVSVIGGLFWWSLASDRKIAGWLQKGGVFIVGTVVACKRNKLPSRKTSEWDKYLDEIQYSFASPDGDLITGLYRNRHGLAKSRSRSDLPKLPTSGTPVVILYLNKNKYYLL